MPRFIPKTCFYMNRIRVNTLCTLMLLAMSFASCSSKYRVEGNSSVINLDGKVLYLKMLQDGVWVPIDSAEVLHGTFKMKGPADSVRMVTLYMNGESIMPLVLESGRIKVSITPTSLEAQGTPLNDKLYKFIKKRNELHLYIEELERKEARMVLDGTNIDDIHDDLKQESEQKLQEMDDYTKQFITDNYENVLGPSVFMMMCSTMPYPLMTPQIEDIMRTAPTAFKEDPLVKDFLTKAKENMKLIEEHKRLQENMAANN